MIAPTIVANVAPAFEALDVVVAVGFVIDATRAIVFRTAGPREWDDPRHSAVVRDFLTVKAQG